MRRLWWVPGVAALFLCMGVASAQETSCVSNEDCAEGEICESTPCAAIEIACDEDDPDCVGGSSPCPDGGVCVPKPTGLGAICESDADCDEDLSCQVVGVAVTAEACAPDNPDCEPSEPSEPVEYKECRPKPCTSDSDCTGGLVCVEKTLPCIGGKEVPLPPCPPGEDCTDQEPTDTIEPCEEETVAYCAPKWTAACEEASDCGEGFECVPQMECSDSSAGSSGSSGSGGAPSEPAPAPTPDSPPEEDEGSTDEDDATDPPESGKADEAEDEDKCQPTGINWCKPIEVVCESDADCPSEWTCVTLPSPPVACTVSPDGEEECEEPPPAESRCMPPHWDGWGISEGGPSGTDLSASAPEGSDNTGSSEEGSKASGSSSGSGSSSSCQVSGSPSAAWLPVFFALLALVAMRRRYGWND